MGYACTCHPSHTSNVLHVVFFWGLPGRLIKIISGNVTIKIPPVFFSVLPRILSNGFGKVSVQNTSWSPNKLKPVQLHLYHTLMWQSGMMKVCICAYQIISKYDMVTEVTMYRYISSNKRSIGVGDALICYSQKNETYQMFLGWIWMGN